MSAARFEQIRPNSPFVFDDRGEQKFRNIVQPIRIYRLRGEMERHVFQVAPTRAAPVQAKRPHSLAVLPIEWSDNDQRYLAEGITEELILELGRFKQLFLISRSATRALSGASNDPQVVGERFGVRYVLGGTIRRLGSQIRLGLSLSETETGMVVWADRLNESLKSLVDRLEEVVSRIASTVLGRIEENDISSARRAKPESMTAYDFYLRGLVCHRLGGVVDENLGEALSWFERAIEADSEFGRPHAMWVCARSGLPDFDVDDGERRIRHALELDPNDPEANRIMGAIMMVRGKFEASRTYHEKAMAPQPVRRLHQGAFGGVLQLRRRAANGFEVARRSGDPRPVPAYLVRRGAGRGAVQCRPVSRGHRRSYAPDVADPEVASLSRGLSRRAWGAYRREGGRRGGDRQCPRADNGVRRNS
jgi:TolB-like protein